MAFRRRLRRRSGPESVEHLRGHTRDGHPGCAQVFERVAPQETFGGGRVNTDGLSWRMAELADKNHVPHSAMAEVTWRCNLNCLHCYLPEGQRRKSAREADELTTDEWRRAMD